MARFTSYRRLSHESTTRDWERRSPCSFRLADTVSPVSNAPVAEASRCTCSLRLWRLASMQQLSSTYCGSEIRLGLVTRSGDRPHHENSLPRPSRCAGMGSLASLRITEGAQSVSSQVSATRFLRLQLWCFSSPTSLKPAPL